MFGFWDHADGYGFQPDSSFYADGTFDIDLSPGDYSITISKGMEYVDQHHTFRVTAAPGPAHTYTIARWINMAAQNWYSADDHIHIRRSPREDDLLLKWIIAEDINVGVLLKMGDFWATYYDQYAWGQKGVAQQGNYLLTSGQEDPRTPEVGHALGFGAADKVRYPDEYYYYDKVFDRLHQLGGVAGYAHQAESFHGYRGLMLDGLRRKIDVLELLQFCVSQDPLQTRHYYHLLDLGYAVTAVAGSDFPWCGKDHDGDTRDEKGRIGNARFYTFISSPFSFTTWRNAVRGGHTFVTSGPMLTLTVNNKLPGDTVYLKRGSTININAQAYGHTQQVPLERLELVAHGKVIATATPAKGGSSATLSLQKQLTVDHGMWLALRAYAGPGQAAHTTPVYVSVGKAGFHNPETLTLYLNLAEQYLKELETEIQQRQENPELQAWRYQKGLQQRIEATRQVIRQLRSK